MTFMCLFLEHKKIWNKIYEPLLIISHAGNCNIGLLVSHSSTTEVYIFYFGFPLDFVQISMFHPQMKKTKDLSILQLYFVLIAN